MTLSKAQFFESTTESHDLDTEFFTTAPNTPMHETNNPTNPGNNSVPLENLYVLLIAGIGIGFYFLRKKPSMN